MKSANIDSIKCEFSEYLFDKTEHPDWLPANPSKAGHKGLSIFGACLNWNLFFLNSKFSKNQKKSTYILLRNIPTDFEKIQTLVGELQVLTDRQTDQPTTRDGNRSSGPKNKTILILTYIYFVIL